MKRLLVVVLVIVSLFMLVVPASASHAGGWFTDCADYPAVERAAALGVVHGYGDGTFRPLGTVTNGEWLQMIYNIFGTTPAFDAYPGDSATYEWMVTTLYLAVHSQAERTPETLAEALAWAESIGCGPTSATWRHVSSGEFVARYEAVELLMWALLPDLMVETTLPTLICTY